MTVTTGASALPDGRQTHAGVGLALWIVLLLLVPSWLVVAPLGAAGSPAELIGLLAMAWWLAARLDRARAAQSVSVPTRLATGVFATALIVSYLAAVTRPIEHLELNAADRGLLVVVSWWGVTLLTTDGLRSRANLDSLLRLFTALSAVAALLGLVQFITGSLIVDSISIPGLSANTDISAAPRNGFARIFGTSSHPIEFGVLLTMALPLALHYGAVDTHRPRWRRYLPVVLICSALPLTMSRSALLGLAIVLIVLFPLWTARQRLLALAVVAVGLMTVYVAVPGLLGTMFKLFTNISTDSSAQSRTDSYGLAFEFVRRAPIFGRGLSTFLPTYRILDNQYLGTVIESGIVGLLALLALFVTALVTSARMSRRLPDAADRGLSRALMAAVAAAALSFATFDALGFPQVAGSVFFAVGCIGALYRQTRPAASLDALAPGASTTSRPTAVQHARLRSQVGGRS